MLRDILWCVLPVSARHYSQVTGSRNMHITVIVDSHAYFLQCLKDSFPLPMNENPSDLDAHPEQLYIWRRQMAPAHLEVDGGDVALAMRQLQLPELARPLSHLPHLVALPEQVLRPRRHLPPPTIHPSPHRLIQLLGSCVLLSARCYHRNLHASMQMDPDHPTTPDESYVGYHA